MKNPVMLVTLIVILVILLLPIAVVSKYLLIALIVCAVLYMKRGYIYLFRASRALNGKKPNPQKAWEYYERGWKAGIAQNYAVMLGNLYVQMGDPHVALTIFDTTIEKENQRKKKNQNIIASAAIARATALWVLHERQKAIQSLEQLRSEGYMDKNLAINLASYLLESGRVEEAGKLIDESRAQMPESPGMLDNRGWYLFLSGDVIASEKVYDTMIHDMTPRFPEAYVHAAHVKMALGKNRQAARLLNLALEKPFYQSSTVQRREVEELLVSLPDSSLGEETMEEQLEEALYDTDLFDDESPNTDVDDDDDLEPHTDLDEEDYEDEDEESMWTDDDGETQESLFFDDEDEEEEDYRT